MTGTLAAELADGALLFARAHRYTLVDRPRVDLVADPSVDAGRHPGRCPLRRPDRWPSAAGRARRTNGDAAGSRGSMASSTMVFTVPRADGPEPPVCV